MVSPFIEPFSREFSKVGRYKWGTPSGTMKKLSGSPATRPMPDKLSGYDLG